MTTLLNPTTASHEREKPQEQAENKDFITHEVLDVDGNTVKLVFHSRLVTPGLEVTLDGPERTTVQAGLPQDVDKNIRVINNSVLYRQAGPVDQNRVTLTTERPSTILVETGIEPVLRAAVALGVENDSIRSSIYEAGQQAESDNLIVFERALMAAKLIDAEGNFTPGNDRTFSGELLFINFLLEDEAAIEEMKTRITALEKHFDEKIEDILAQETTSEVMSIDELDLVHVTSYEPEDNRPGHRTLKPLMTSLHESKGVIPRTTLHFTLNHGVQSHLYGNWDNASYVVVAPMSSVIEKNGLPVNTNPVDTYFDVGPFGEVKLDGSETIIMPGMMNTGELYRSDEKKGEIRYRTSGFDEVTLRQLNVLLSDNSHSAGPQGYEKIARALGMQLYGYIAAPEASYGLSYEEEEDSEEDALLRIKINEIRAFIDEDLSGVDKNMRLTEMLFAYGVEGLVDELFQQKEDDDNPNMRKAMTQAIEGVLAKTVQNSLTNMTILKSEKRVYEPAQWGWQDEEAQGRLHTLINKYGLRGGEHGHSAESTITNSAARVINENIEGELTKSEIERSLDIDTEDLKTLSFNGLLLAYEVGVLDFRTSSRNNSDPLFNDLEPLSTM